MTETAAGTPQPADQPADQQAGHAADRQRLKELIGELAVVRGKVTLSSGKEADYYIDLRRITLQHEAAPLVGRVIRTLLSEAGINYVAAGGLTMGADPVGTAVMHAAAQDGVATDTFVVRKAQKSHGMGRQVEGPSVEGRKVVVLEDTSTTGGSALTAVDAVRAAGGIVQAVAVIVDRDTGAKEHIEATAGVPYLFAYSKNDLGLD
ncbi:orotate phosphoribosyltransferase [Nesterenkonia sandarakina]|uniref:Orotate phosphoribosyltransferase n=1 Tax=Nesterenkonia sandarakina TaxID=272918 RepID=A0A7Z0E7Z6_9MICC|nr:orotate phosphoribosyltransferase [Nesterenkonia sandarakina]